MVIALPTMMRTTAVPCGFLLSVALGLALAACSSADESPNEGGSAGSGGTAGIDDGGDAGSSGGGHGGSAGDDTDGGAGSGGSDVDGGAGGSGPGGDPVASGHQPFAFARPGYDDVTSGFVLFEGQSLVAIQNADGDDLFRTDEGDVADQQRLEKIAFGKWKTGEVTELGNSNGGFLDALSPVKEVHYVVCPKPSPDWNEPAGLEFSAVYATTPTSNHSDAKMVLTGSTLRRNSEGLMDFDLAIHVTGLDYTVNVTDFKRGVSQSGKFDISRPSDDPSHLLANPKFRVGFCGEDAEYAYVLGRFTSAPGGMFSFAQIFRRSVE